MASKVLKRPSSAVAEKQQLAAKKVATLTVATPNGHASIPAVVKDVPEELKGLHAFIINLERRPDRWARVVEMLNKETPWLSYEQFKASDGTQNPIPEEDISVTWNTKCNAHFADYFEWVFDAPDTPLHGTQWKWACNVSAEDQEWQFTEDGDDEWDYGNCANDTKKRTGTLKKIATNETFKVKLQFAEAYKEPGLLLRMSGGERGCAHSHLRVWRLAAERAQHTLVLEDDVQLRFDRSDSRLGKMNGKVFTERLSLALKHVPADFDVLYLGWAGWRDGHYRQGGKAQGEQAEADLYIRKAEYVWTTVAYVISQAGAKKLLAVAAPMNQPVDNFMAWEASQGRLNSYVVIDEGDNDGTYAGGIVDQFDFQSDSDIKKSDGGHQGDNEKEFAVQE